MNEISAVISARESLAPGIYSMELLAEEIAGAAVPGQFLSLYSSDGSRLLPRPISICDVKDQTLRLVYRVAGKGTGEFSKKKEGDRIRVIGPLGNGFPEAESFSGKRAVLFGGGIGIPPMLFAAKRLRNAGALVTAFLGYRDRQTFLSEEFLPFADVNVATEDGSIGTKGNVMDAFLPMNLEPDVIFACGPAPMLSAIRSFSMERGIPCYISLEERMACGIGACLGCVKKTTEIDSHSGVKNARVCRDGPVFKAELVDL